MANMVVSVPPGWMTMTGMCHGASSVRSAVDRDSSAALLAPIGLAKGAATRAVGALMLMIRPCPKSFRGAGHAVRIGDVERYHTDVLIEGGVGLRADSGVHTETPYGERLHGRAANAAGRAGEKNHTLRHAAPDMYR